MKPEWDDYFIAMAFLVSARSSDPHEHKNGCVITDDQHRILGVGYNGSIQGIDDSKIPGTRPEKYMWLVHAEQNAIMFSNGLLTGGTAYVTGPPCSTCAKMLAQKGISRIVYSAQECVCVHDNDFQATLNMLKMAGVSIESYKSPGILSLLEYTADRIKNL